VKLIDADALIENLDKTLNELTTDEARGCLCTTIIRIACAPTIEPERKKGEWISGAENFNTNYSHECSQCGALIDMYHGGADDYFFCPICGADMRGEQNE